MDSYKHLFQVTRGKICEMDEIDKTIVVILFDYSRSISRPIQKIQFTILTESFRPKPNCRRKI